MAHSEDSPYYASHRRALGMVSLTMAADENENVNPWRAGRCITQPRGYKASIPAPLSPDPPVRIDESLRVLLLKADCALDRLDGSIQTLPHPDLFLYMCVRKEAVLSSQIKGSRSSLQDVLAADARLAA